MKVASFLFALLFASLSFASTQNAPNKMVAVVLLMDTEDAKTVVGTIYTTFMTAEKIANVLNVEMRASDEAVDDVFIFSLKSSEQKELTMKMFDEEGYELAAHRVMQLDEGEGVRGKPKNTVWPARSQSVLVVLYSRIM